MIVSSGFGSTGVTGADCPAGGDWSAWCDCSFPAGVDPTNNGKCKQWRPGAPWTVVGAMLRGIPQLSTGGGVAAGAGGILSTITSLFSGGGSTPGAPVSASVDNGIFGIPKTVALVGGGVLVLGAGAFILSQRKKANSRRSMAGTTRRRKTRRR